MDHMVYRGNFPIYEPSTTVVSKPNRLALRKLKLNKNITKSCEMPKLILELYEKNRTK